MPSEDPYITSLLRARFGAPARPVNDDLQRRFGPNRCAPVEGPRIEFGPTGVRAVAANTAIPVRRGCSQAEFESAMRSALASGLEIEFRD
jgi:hypothetical protein